MKIVKHVLADEDESIAYEASPNVGGRLTHRQYLIMHYTAGENAEGAIRQLCDPKSKASAHIVIGTDGKVTQLVPFNRIAWHAGKAGGAARVG